MDNLERLILIVNSGYTAENVAHRRVTTVLLGLELLADRAFAGPGTASSKSVLVLVQHE